MKDVWRFAGMRAGVLCAMTTGELLMQLWHVDSLDIQQPVRQNDIIY